ncbi:MAG: hypothetical protein LBK77_01395 [Spirochaetaceae bacterium]|jgi:hypothetical protein|nr:hypothetical protein [Spirochaetaceae bacterium]
MCWWESFVPREGVWYRWNLWGAEIAVRRGPGGRWQGFCRSLSWNDCRGACSGPLEGEAPDGAAITALWEVPPENTEQRIALTPCLPAKPFLVFPADTLRLSPGTEAILELEMPPIARLTLHSGGSSEVLFTFTPFTVKETWYGEDTMTGILCYVLPAANGARQVGGDRQAGAGGTGPAGTAVGGTAESVPGVRCRLLLRNRTRTILEPGKMPLHVEELSVYGQKNGGDCLSGALYSDMPVIDVYGGEDFRVSFRWPETGGDHANIPSLIVQGSKSGMGGLLVHHGARIIKSIAGLP